MKKRLIKIAIFMLPFSGLMSQKNDTNVKRCFEYHFRILDSVNVSSTTDTIHCCYESIIFMESKTKIKSSAFVTFFGVFSFRKEDLIKWHDWYNDKYGKIKKSH